MQYRPSLFKLHNIMCFVVKKDLNNQSNFRLLILCCLNSYRKQCLFLEIVLTLILEVAIYINCFLIQNARKKEHLSICFHYFVKSKSFLQSRWILKNLNIFSYKIKKILFACFFSKYSSWQKLWRKGSLAVWTPRYRQYPLYLIDLNETL